MEKEAQKVKKTKIWPFAAAGLAVAVGGFLFMTAPGRPKKQQKNVFMGRNIAHRGLHDIEKGIPENSLAAFEAAAAAGYGVELDVQLSKDGQVVVFHDDDLLRVCGVDARVDSLTFAELSQLRLLGTDEKIPLFSEVLSCIRGRGPMIVELKTGKHNKELCRKTCDLLRCYVGEYCIESFNPFIVRWFKKHAPHVLRGQLAAPKEDYQGSQKPLIGWMLSRTLFNFLCRPQFIAYKIGKKPFTVRLAEFLGAIKVGWTSHECANEKDYDTVIFELYKPNRKFK